MPMPPPPRAARLVLVRPTGDVLGVLPPFDVPVPWWQEVAPVVVGARERFGGLNVVVLRILETAEPTPHGGLVTYLAETRDEPPSELSPWSGTLPEHPLRLPWARPGGPDGDLAWAHEELARRGIRWTEPAEQVRAWNLSSLWRLPIEGGSVWLKHVPPFFSHEGAILARLAGGPVPGLVAHDRGRILMPEIAGDDLYDARRPVLDRMVATLVDLQRAWIGRTDELLALGLPDWRGDALARAIGEAVDRTAPELDAADGRALSAFVDDLPRRFRAVGEAGIPDTLVHGDFHPGNVRGTDSQITLLDWGDSGVGHPLLDQAAFLDRIPPGDVTGIRDLWHEAWRASVPGSDPARAANLLAPVAAARQVVIYLTFLDGIEPSERPFHAADPADWLGRTARLIRDG
jgi:hypothetical protein